MSLECGSVQVVLYLKQRAKTIPPIKNSVFRNKMPCRFVINYRLFGSTCCLHFRGTRRRPSSLFFCSWTTIKTEIARSSRTSVNNHPSTKHNTPEDTICETPKPRNSLTIRWSAYSIVSVLINLSVSIVLTCSDGLKHAGYIATIEVDKKSETRIKQ
jgi:hypothetical protein